MTVAADCSDTPDTYQWYLNGDSIPDATSSSITIGSVLAIGNYSLDLLVIKGTSISSAGVFFTVAGGGKILWAKYGETGDFHPEWHSEFKEVYSLSCWNGASFDANVDEYIADSVDVIFIGGDNTFSTSTADLIDSAVYYGGKILVINFWADLNFSTCLPGTRQTNAPYGPSIKTGDRNNPIVAEILSGISDTIFYRKGENYNRDIYEAKPNATVITYFADNSPAFEVWKYGAGAVIHQPLELMGCFYPDSVIDKIVYNAIYWALKQRKKTSNSDALDTHYPIY